MTKSKTKLIIIERKSSVKRSAVRKAVEEVYAAKNTSKTRSRRKKSICV